MARVALVSVAGHDAHAGVAQRCVFCLANGHLRGDQVLERGEYLYLCAPRGQLVEGCLIVAPYRCLGCFARAPASHHAELARMQRGVEDFYAAAYGSPAATFYEQGRAGGGAAIDAGGGFPHHAHLCCLPLALDLHALLAPGHAACDEPALAALRVPYVYADSIDGSGDRRRTVYVARSPDGRTMLERLRLKPILARSIGWSGCGDWRAHPGDEKLERLVARYREHSNRGEPCHE